MFKSKKGFTLVELLAVIVILAIILAIAVPSIAGIINGAKKGSFESNAKSIVVGIEYKVLEAQVDTTKTAPVVHTAGSGADNVAEVANYGANPTDYSYFEITSMDPITITLTSTAASQFGAFTVTATKSTVTFQ
ncbi:MAG: prepilin-type N-terminal cleavage/methylation domain-containing protein [Bacilli bacterium]|jgi:type IV pilus assembly protein PilA